MEFNYIERINKLIDEDNYENAIQLIKKRNDYFMYSIEEWNLFDISVNLLYIKVGNKELSPWSKNKDNLEKIKEIKRQLHKPVEKYIYDYLKENGNTNFSNIKKDLVRWMLETMELEQMFAERLAAKALLEICIEFDKDSDLIDFCWDELRIKQSQ